MSKERIGRGISKYTDYDRQSGGAVIWWSNGVEKGVCESGREGGRGLLAGFRWLN